jgi:DNA-directed RNA polymerase sigma subunit (sigma70/sigma32)
MTPRLGSLPAASPDLLSFWFNNLSRYHRLDEAETNRLLAQVWEWQQDGIYERKGRRACDRLVMHNLRLVVDVWKRYYSFLPSGDPRLVDLFQAGVSSMIKGILRFDPSRKLKFSTYVVHWIRAGMTLYVTTLHRMIRVPERCAYAVNKGNRFRDKFIMKHGRQPTMEEISKEIQVPVETLAFYFAAYRDTNATSGNDTWNEGKPNEPLDSVPNPEGDNFDQREGLAAQVEEIFDAAGLSDLERELLLRVNSENFRADSRPITVVAHAMGLNVHEGGRLYRSGVRRCRKAAGEKGLSLAAILSQV